jgi:hypothetical protein
VDINDLNVIFSDVDNEKEKIDSIPNGYDSDYQSDDR